ncbi:MAG: DUF370 domain-containing protein [Clostridiales bacterium]|nr:DUF370 domain-containing protein [Clostridiales bacterium]
MQLINIGYGNLVSADKVMTVVSPEAAPVKRIINDAREKGKLIDASCGRKTQSVIITTTDHIILCAANLKQIAQRFGDEEDDKV